MRKLVVNTFVSLGPEEDPTGGFPVVLGAGKRLFGDGTIAIGLKLADTTVTKTGVTIITYERAGEIEPGSFEFGQPTEAELRRRERLAAGH